MKKYFCIILIITVLCFDNCTPHQRFIVVNNSDEEIMLVRTEESPLKDSIFHPENMPESVYKDFLMDTRTKPHSSRNIGYWGDWLYDDSDTTFFRVFNVIDYDTMSLEEFKNKYPIKHVFKVTLQDMIDRDWTLIYPPIEQLLCVEQLLNSISKCNNWDVDDKIIDNFIVMNQKRIARNGI